jgi:hypothetical protein
MRLPLFFSLATLLAGTLALIGQTPPPDFNRTGSGRQRSYSESQAIRGAYEHQRQQEARQRDWIRNQPVNSGSSARSVLVRKRNKFADSLVTPTKEESSEHRETLSQSNSGIVTLLGPNSCSQPIDDPEEVLITGTNCLDQAIPGLGRQFSFRSRDHVSMGLADLGIAAGWFFGYGYFTQTILTDLGDIPLREVSLDRPGLEFLREFIPATTIEGSNKQRVELENGVVRDELQFFNAVKAVTNHTYILRSVAYRGELVTVLNLGDRKVRFDRLKGDKREDVIVAFRVIHVNDNGTVRLIWRKLSGKDSPELPMPVTEVSPTNTPSV